MTGGRENIPGVLLLPIDAEVVAKEKDAVLSCDKEIADISTPLGRKINLSAFKRQASAGAALSDFLGYVK